MNMQASANEPKIAPPSHKERRELGIYYTPAHVAREMAAWAIKDHDDVVLDPSFGGCVFLRSAIHRLKCLGSEHPERQVIGIDRDSRAHYHAQRIIEAGADLSQFRIGDFLVMRRSDFPSGFTAILGNPPYISHHTLNSELHQAARNAVADDGYKLSDLASYWAYFVLHCIRFVRPGGRLALVLPGILLHAHYAREVRTALRSAFGRLSVILVEEQLFPTAEEESVIILAENRGSSDSEVRVGTASRSVLHLDQENLDRITRHITPKEHERSWLRGLLDARTLEVYDWMTERSVRLGDEAIIRIGAVTGANQFFVVKPSKLRQLEIPTRYTRPIISRATQLSGLTFRPRDLQALLSSDVDALLIDAPVSGSIHPRLQDYLDGGARDGVAVRKKCLGRSPWYVVPGTAPPDAFLLYMAWFSPRLALNMTAATSTNAIHGLTWRQGHEKARANSIALASLTTLSQLSAELEGRSYGGGVLKLEPSEASRLVLPLITSVDRTDAFGRAERFCRTGQRECATLFADRVLLNSLISPDDIALLRRALAALRRRRATRAKGPAPSVLTPRE